MNDLFCVDRPLCLRSPSFRAEKSPSSHTMLQQALSIGVGLMAAIGLRMLPHRWLRRYGNEAERASPVSQHPGITAVATPREACRRDRQVPSSGVTRELSYREDAGCALHAVRRYLTIQA
jgi:hypothetical protein